MKTKLAPKFLFIGIILIAAFFRLYDVNWDQGYHLHPDERFLTMVGNAMRLPLSFSQYLDPQTSLFNPANIGFKFYVYGTFPLILNKLFAIVFSTDTYNDFTLQGRLLSGVSDLLIVFLIYKTLLLFEHEYKLNPKIKYWGAFFYAISVLPIQLSHFFTVDTFLNLFLFASFYTILRFSLQGKFSDLFLSAVFFGFASATKLNAVYVLPLLLFLLVRFVKKRHITNEMSKKSILKYLHNKSIRIRVAYACLLTVFYCALIYLTIRIADPYLFQSKNIFDPRPSILFLDNLKMLNYWNSPAVWYPPGVQWIHKTPILFSLQNLVFFGIGVPYFLFVFIGMVITLRHWKRSILLVILIWTGIFFLYQSAQYVQTMRYFLIIYPFLAIFAAFGFHTLTKKWNPSYKALIVLLILFWPLLFFSIYTKKHSRVEASMWIYQNIPDGSMLLTEHWDDPLPLLLPQYAGRQYAEQQLPVFDQDAPEKWQKMNTLLANADYYILSSNRAWGSMPTVPEKYPLMNIFYKELFGGKRGFTKVKEFTSYPSLTYLGIPFELNDDWAEEAFTVYDHPKVLIFKINNK